MKTRMMCVLVAVLTVGGVYAQLTREQEAANAKALEGREWAAKNDYVQALQCYEAAYKSGQVVSDMVPETAFTNACCAVFVGNGNSAKAAMDYLRENVAVTGLSADWIAWFTAFSDGYFLLWEKKPAFAIAPLETAMGLVTVLGRPSREWDTAFFLAQALRNGGGLGVKLRALEMTQAVLLDGSEYANVGQVEEMWKYIATQAPRLSDLDQYEEYLRRLDATYSALTGAQWVPFLESVRNARNGALK